MVEAQKPGVKSTRIVSLDIVQTKTRQQQTLRIYTVELWRHRGGPHYCYFRWWRSESKKTQFHVIERWQHFGKAPVVDLGLKCLGMAVNDWKVWIDWVDHFHCQCQKRRNTSGGDTLVGTCRDGWNRCRELLIVIRLCETQQFIHGRVEMVTDLSQQ